MLTKGQLKREVDMSLIDFWKTGQMGHSSN